MIGRIWKSVSNGIRWVLGATPPSPLDLPRVPLDLRVAHFSEDPKLIAEVFKAVGDHFRNDINAIWQRGNFFLIVNSAFLGIFASAKIDRCDDWRPIVLSIAGIATSYAWQEILNMTVQWINVWRVALVDTERALVYFGPFARGENLSGNSEHELCRPELYSKVLARIFLLIWGAILLSNLYGRLTHDSEAKTPVEASKSNPGKGSVLTPIPAPLLVQIIPGTCQSNPEHCFSPNETQPIIPPSRLRRSVNSIEKSSDLAIAHQKTLC